MPCAGEGPAFLFITAEILLREMVPGPLAVFILIPLAGAPIADELFSMIEILFPETVYTPPAELTEIPKAG
mgnify:CR=1 FL=1